MAHLKGSARWSGKRNQRAGVNVISRDLFERHHLKVLNAASPSAGSASNYILEDPALTNVPATFDAETLRRAAISTLRTISDPEIPLKYLRPGPYLRT